MRLLIVIILLFGVFVNPACGSEDDWLFYFGNDDGKRYFNKNIRTISDTHVRVWEKYVYSEKMIPEIIEFLERINKYSGTKPAYGLDYIEFDCKGFREAPIAMSIYDARGKLLARRPEVDAQWYDVVPDSIHELLFRRVCK